MSANPLGAIGAGVGIYTSILGAQQQAVGARYTGQAQAAMYNYQAGVAEQNAKIAATEANVTSGAGAVPVEEAGLAGRATIAATRAGQGAGNIATGTGSAGRVVTSEQKLSQVTQGVQEFNVEQQAYGQRVQAAQGKAEAGALRTAAGTSVAAGKIGAQSAIISGAGQVAAKFAQLGTSFGMPGTGNLFGSIGS